MNILIPPHSFKQTLSPYQTPSPIQPPFPSIFPDPKYIKIPIPDPTQHILQSLLHPTPPTILNQLLTAPLRKPLDPFFPIFPHAHTPLIHIAPPSPLHLLPPQKRNPLF
ncbi:glycerate kinase, partial [Bacillus altitudinis]|uniref:glycerate kinase n=1 Tax=Bacillus altitudinis TaxID=293387 RepID=UPI001643BB4F